jgi:hypothetical protein
MIGKRIVRASFPKGYLPKVLVVKKRVGRVMPKSVRVGDFSSKIFNLL